MGQVKTVLFDLGNVLVYIDFDEFWRSLGFLSPEEIAPFTNGYKLWTHQFEIGFISTSEYLTGLQSVFKNRFNIKQLEQAFTNIIREPVEGMIDIVKCVSRTHRTALVSNTNEIHYGISIKKFDVHQYPSPTLSFASTTCYETSKWFLCSHHQRPKNRSFPNAINR